MASVSLIQVSARGRNTSQVAAQAERETAPWRSQRRKAGSPPAYSAPNAVTDTAESGRSPGRRSRTARSMIPMSHTAAESRVQRVSNPPPGRVAKAASGAARAPVTPTATSGRTPPRLAKR